MIFPPVVNAIVNSVRKESPLRNRVVRFAVFPSVRAGAISVGRETSFLMAIILSFG